MWLCGIVQDYSHCLGVVSKHVDSCTVAEQRLSATPASGAAALLPTGSLSWCAWLSRLRGAGCDSTAHTLPPGVPLMCSCASVGLARISGAAADVWWCGVALGGGHVETVCRLNAEEAKSKAALM